MKMKPLSRTSKVILLLGVGAAVGGFICTPHHFVLKLGKYQVQFVGIQNMEFGHMVLRPVNDPTKVAVEWYSLGPIWIVP